MPTQVYRELVNERIGGGTKTFKPEEAEEEKQILGYFLSGGWRSGLLYELVPMGTAMPTPTPVLPSVPVHRVPEVPIEEPQAARIAVPSGFDQAGSATSNPLREQSFQIPASGYIVLIPGTAAIQDVSIRPRPSFETTAEAWSLIKEQGLEAVVRTIKQAIEDLSAEGARVKEVIVEREGDPEIEDREVLAVTVWVEGASAESALSFWKLLYERLRLHEAALSTKERDKLEKWVSIGVDIE